MADGFFRSKSGYTVVQNAIVRDTRVSLKAKGLYLTIQAYITMPDKIWYKDEFLAMVSEGETAFDNAWKELKEAKYLRVHGYPNGGRGWRYEFELLDEPCEGPHTIYYDANGNPTKTNETANRGKNRKAKDEEMPKNGDSSQYPENHTIANHRIANQHIAKQCNAEQCNAEQTIANGGINNKSSLTKTDNNYLYTSPSVNSSLGDTAGEPVDNPVSSGRKRRKGIYSDINLDLNKKVLEGDSFVVMDEVDENRGIPDYFVDDVKKMTVAIQTMCGWNDFFAYERSQEEQEIYKHFVENLIEMATCTERMDFNGSIISYKNVIDRINEVYNSSNGCERGFEGLLFCVNRRYREASIRFKLDNPKQYMKPIIWESFSFYKLDWQNFFNRTYYGDYKD